jgi:hypothetical protein
VEYCCTRRAAAEKIAAKFEGFGPSLYLRTWEEWNQYLGSYGGAVHALLVERRYLEGAMPKGFEVHDPTIPTE